MTALNDSASQASSLCPSNLEIKKTDQNLQEFFLRDFFLAFESSDYFILRLRPQNRLGIRVGIVSSVFQKIIRDFKKIFLRSGILFPGD